MDIDEQITVTMSARNWILLMGVLGTVNDNSGAAEALIDRVMDKVM